MTQQLRNHTALTKDLSSGLSTHILQLAAAYKYSSKGGSDASGMHILTDRHTERHIF